MGAILAVKNVTKKYRLGHTSVQALAGITLDVRSGEALFLVGPSGSGKSTLLHIMGCLDHPTSGEVMLGDKAVAGFSDNELAQFRACNLGYIFQNYSLLPVLNVYENIEYPLILAGITARKQRVRQILDEVGLTGYEKRFPGELSGGQRQRVAVARALVGQPRIIIADEPTANLDTVNGAKVLKLMLDLAQKQGAAAIIATHDERILRAAKRVVHLNDGAISVPTANTCREDDSSCTP